MSKFVVGLTGGIGSGKTTVANEFERLGAGLVDADIIAREVVAKGESTLAEIHHRFGDQVLAADGELNRDALRQQVFSDESQRQWLNNLLHPLIRQRMIDQSQQQVAPYTILVIPLLVENKLQTLCKRVLCVDVPVSVQVLRTSQRDGVTNSSAKAIIARQATRWQRLRAANDVLNNNRVLESVAKDILHLHQHYLEFATQSYPS
ncbi:dephospho-CoA kinase [Neiella marina]|uniref:Dephospho-CoA kinase n=1 Tax=Neiella holothuriorum TaxID=2870530 RepID=A0ABS7EC53_9GAMM|nr:dephospho-CoA kinase [Neiella holothuriorum]MBW8189548.1 dephospho-CoA kinase [Neiella holothuriorum]